MKTAIYGAGSMGTVLGAYITQAGTPIDLITRNKAHVEALKAHGARIEGTASFTTPVSALTPEDMTGVYDILFLMTKQQDTAQMMAFLSPHLAPDGVICSLQNGIPEPDMADILGEERVLGCSVAWGATLEEPGRVSMTSDKDSMTFSLGGLGKVNLDRLEQVKALLELMCPVAVEKNFLGGRWAKLLINAAFSGMGTVIGGTFGDVADDKRARLCAQKVMKECIDVSRAAGVKMEPVQGKDLVKIFDYTGPLKQKIAFVLIPVAIKKHRLIKPSMLQDLEKGKKCEVDFINGQVCATGRKHGVPTPYNDTIVAVIHGIEEGKYTPCPDNLSLFQGL
ncbi:2-dehydropantoate 2-reductase [Desulfosarcina sp. OttesenSCG-928-A07]|nr:2-dehydropantoate 2-reductase [Desulfosarcina sp. OttesenSCG-928-G17]MDL2328291.1 2-dehydropantoate 2-reductase [Desulfosarcina sp. OttesenSCG-928-A07]